MFSILWEIGNTALAMIAVWYLAALVVHLRYKPIKGSRYRMTICEIKTNGESEDLFEVSKARYVRFETAFMLLNLLDSNIGQAECLIPHSTCDTLLVSKVTTRHAIVVQNTGDLARVMDELYDWKSINS